MTSPRRKKLAKDSAPKPLVRRAQKQTAPKGHRGTVRMLESILRIHQLLRTNNSVSTQRLQEELEVKDRSTIGRYINIMKERLNADIRYDQDARGYRYFGDPIELPDPMLTEGDLLALYVASPILAQYRGTPLGEQFEASFGKIVSLLPEPVRNRMLNVPKRVETRTRGPNREDARCFAHVLNALHHDRELEIGYASAHRGTSTIRTVDPYVLCIVDSKWYLLARDHLRGHVVSFAVDRIWTAKQTSREFVRPPHFSAAEYLKDTFGIYRPPEESEERATEIVIRFDALSARYVRETKWHSTQKIRELSGKEIELSFTVRGTIEVERFVLEWGEHAEVLAPSSLRKRVRERLARAFAKYGMEA